MTVAEFLAWCPDDGERWELVDGAPRAVPLQKIVHGRLQAEIGAMLGNHLREQSSSDAVVMQAGLIPAMRASFNLRLVPLAVVPMRDDHEYMTDPLLVIETLSSENQARVWANVWTYASIPSVREILLLHVDAMRAALLRRDPDGGWAETSIAADGELHLSSIGFRTPMAAPYRTTALGRTRR